MAPNITKLIILTILCVIIKHQLFIIQGQQQVPCLFFMGDSQTDNGNNNFLLTTAKSNYLPYGIDYPNGPTGRFSSGKNIPDFLAQFLGFDKSIPPFANAKGSEILKGVNYGSGAAGILDESGRQQGDRISMNKQLLLHGLTVLNFNLLLRNSSRAKDRLSKCLYVINMGSNDYLNNYFLPQFYHTSTIYTPDKFADFLIQRYTKQLKTLYNYGARKIAVFGLGRLGCLPITLSMYPMNESPCVDSVNNATQLFNSQLKPLIIDNLNNELANAQFILINAFNIAQGDPSLAGIKFTNVSCCITTPLTGLCVRGQVPCNDRNEYSFWDSIHPSEILNRVTATRAYNTSLPSDVYPFDIHRLVQQ